MATDSLLHSCSVQRSRAIANRIHVLLHFAAILRLLYYRASRLFSGDVPVFGWWLMAAAELIFTFIWVCVQAFRWRPVVRQVYPGNLPGDSHLPRIDVFVCTVDPKKEPILEVMNTVLSAMALDYPPEKLAVYISDDGGVSLTLHAVREAALFAESWVPFCRRHGIKTRCPETYFSAPGDDEKSSSRSNEFDDDKEKLQAAYELFKKNVGEGAGVGDCVVDDRPPRVEVIHDNTRDNELKMPLLVYVSREKRPSHPHRFKAGALNSLLRVSGIMSNAPFLLVLDCDMYCNDPASARQAMCFHLDPTISPSLGFVQYPQIFYNISKNDIYDGQARSAYKTKWQGMDGLQGPMFTGTGYYLKRKALYCRPNHEDEFLSEPEKNFGPSTAFISSLKDSLNQEINKKEITSDEILKEARDLATCTFETNTKWGSEIGYSYGCLLESTITSYLLHCKGWKSTYLFPKRPCFLGCTTIDLKDALTQQMKWSSGLFQVALSKYTPVFYGISRLPLLQCMCYAYFMFVSVHSFALLLYGIVPQFCFMTGIPLYPKISDPWFGAFGIVCASSLGQHLYEVLSTGGSSRTWWNEQRIWVIKSVTACLFGCLDCLLKLAGVAKSNFRLTNKVIDQEKLEKYDKGKFEFKGAEMFMVPLRLLLVWNLLCFVIGVIRLLLGRNNVGEMFGQFLLCSYVLALGYPLLEDMIMKRGKTKNN